MEKHIEELRKFIEVKNPESLLNIWAKDDSFLKIQWDKAKRDSKNINTKEDVDEAINQFLRTVKTSPTNIRERNKYKDGMLIAQYRAIYAIRVWLNNEFKISILRSPSFPPLTEEVVNDIISRMNEIISQI